MIKKILFSWIMIIGMPVVQIYMDITSNAFINTASVDDNALEYTGNMLLAPLQYILDGKYAVKSNDKKTNTYILKERFDYDNHWQFKTALSLYAIPLTTIPGLSIKALGFIDQNSIHRHNKIAKALKGAPFQSHLNDYHSMSIYWDAIDKAKPIPPAEHTRRPGDEEHLKTEKEALQDIVNLLNKANIAWWADVGTALGAYRYGGVIPWDNDIDIGILHPDFHNVKLVLQDLDPNKYIVQDWSSRGKPDTYLKVYVKENGSLIDIYNYKIDEDRNELIYILSNIDNIFLPAWWKIRESRYTMPVPISMIFPLKRANFDGITVYVPNDIEGYLKVRYGENIEPNMVFDPYKNQYVEDPSHPYWKLRDVAFPATYSK